MNPKILIIDDDEKLTRLLERFLGDFGFTVVSVHVPSEGLKLLHRQPFDLLILDIMLPEMDGLEELRDLAGGLPDEFDPHYHAHGPRRGDRQDRRVGTWQR